MVSGEVDDFPEVIQRLNEFLMPVVDAVRNKAEFDDIWNPAGGWEKV